MRFIESQTHKANHHSDYSTGNFQRHGMEVMMIDYANELDINMASKKQLPSTIARKRSGKTIYFVPHLRPPVQRPLHPFGRSLPECATFALTVRQCASCISLLLFVFFFLLTNCHLSQRWFIFVLPMILWEKYASMQYFIGLPNEYESWLLVMISLHVITVNIYYMYVYVNAHVCVCVL